MSVVLLRLAGPLQSWGSSSRFNRRATNAEPTKSGVLGLVAAAMGLRRTDPLDDLRELVFGVRADQPGQLLHDFQTAHREVPIRGGKVHNEALPLSWRHYLSDAAFLAILEGDDEIVGKVDSALRRPQFPLFLGRRSCPPAGPVALGVTNTRLDEALASWPWLAGRHEQRRTRSTKVRLAAVRDARPGEQPTDLIRDIPVSFDPNRRRHEWRPVVRYHVEISNPHGVAPMDADHDPMAALEV